MRKFTKKYRPVHTPEEYKSVHTGAYQYVLLRTAIHQVYRIPDDQDILISLAHWQFRAVISEPEFGKNPDEVLLALLMQMAAT
jgi:hypothetical protein